MEARSKRILTVSLAAAASAVLIAVWLFRPPSTYDASKVHPRLAALVEPLTEIRCSLMQDGGSLNISLTDANGKTLRCFVPAYPDRYTRLQLGTLGQKLEDYEEVQDHESSFLMLQYLLHTNRGLAPFSAYIGLSMLRGRVRDYLGVLWNRGGD